MFENPCHDILIVRLDLSSWIVNWVHFKLFTIKIEVLFRVQRCLVNLSNTNNLEPLDTLDLISNTVINILIDISSSLLTKPKQ